MEEEIAVTASQDEPEVKDVLQHDLLLQMLVNVANRSGIGFGVSLCVGGFLISGTIVSGRYYCEQLGTDLAALFEGTGLESTGEILKNGLDQQAAQYGPGPLPEDDDDSSFNPSYIHLQDARIYIPGVRPIPDNQPVWWRGKISAVDGWTLGTLSLGSTQ